MTPHTPYPIGVYYILYYCFINLLFVLLCYVYLLCHNDISPHRLNLEPSIIARETSPSPSNNGTSLLSLPWEIVTQIASHLPAQCVINVLPQVILLLLILKVLPCKEFTACFLQTQSPWKHLAVFYV